MSREPSESDLTIDQQRLTPLGRSMSSLHIVIRENSHEIRLHCFDSATGKHELDSEQHIRVHTCIDRLSDSPDMLDDRFDLPEELSAIAVT